MAALALSTDPADPQNLRRDPDRPTVPLISPQMWLMMVIQAIFQVIVALVLYFAGASILGLSTTDPVVQLEIDEEITTLVFNTFVFSQICMSFSFFFWSSSFAVVRLTFFRSLYSQSTQCSTIRSRVQRFPRFHQERLRYGDLYCQLAQTTLHPREVLLLTLTCPFSSGCWTIRHR
jgi:magnesium-transporting ATPase (P-type)